MMLLRCFIVFWLSSSTLYGAPLPLGVLPAESLPAPPLKLLDLDGNPFELKTGQWAMIHFWASWCPPCRKEMPSLQNLAEKLDTKKMQLVLVNTAESEVAAFTYLSAIAPDLNTLMDKDGSVTNSWQPRGLPASFIVDPSGRIRYTTFGGLDWNKPEYLEFLYRVSAPLE